MGMYANHGVEYRVELPCGRSIVVVNRRDSDARLLDSSFYAKRSATWFDPTVIYRRNFAIPIEDAEDLRLTPEETLRLRTMLEASGSERHGWYEVNTIESTL